MAAIQTVKTEDFEMDYFCFGTGSRNFVIIPGLSIKSVMESSEAVEVGFGLMRNDFTVYVFDRRKTIPEGYSIYDMADDTAAAMKALGLQHNYIFGASQGGMIAQVIAVRYPELVEKMALGSTSPHVRESQRAVIEKWIALAKAGRREELYQEYGREIYPKDVYEQYREYFNEVSATVTDEELERFVILASSIPGFDISGELSRINCPVLALGAFEDPVLDSDATMEIAANLDYRPDFALYMYNGYGHAAFDTAPDYRKRVYDFFIK